MFNFHLTAQFTCANKAVSIESIFTCTTVTFSRVSACCICMAWRSHGTYIDLCKQIQKKAGDKIQMPMTLYWCTYLADTNKFNVTSEIN